MKRLVIVFAALAVFATAASASHSWGGYHWARTSSSVPLTLVDSVVNTWQGALTTAGNDWNTADLAITVSPTDASDKRTRQRCAAVTGQVRVCDYTYGNNGWLGIAGIYLSGDHITKGYVKLNDTYFNTTTYNTPAWRALVTCQEIGHTLGLDHQDEAFGNANLDTCMDYTNDPTTNEHPNAHDYYQLKTIYSHLDGTTTIAGSTAALPGRS